jgi:hypothetical protein
LRISDAVEYRKDGFVLISRNERLWNDRFWGAKPAGIPDANFLVPGLCGY